ncbi:MAG TPA: sulfocyanin-like copper-binding protein [Acidimicrobiales bacterium]|nr:sulfocyanin-like copper-binding protein [Acidimicrobiales bacterium]
MSGPTIRLAAAAVVVLTVLSLGVAWEGRVSSPGSPLTACAPLSARGSVVRVTLSDGGPMMMGGWLRGASLTESPASVSAGWVTFVATNVGTVRHELVVLPLATGAAGRLRVGPNGRIDESSSLGEASTSCGAGAGDGLAPRTRGWVSLRLAPGRYEIVCDVPWHYASGMSASLRVDARSL